VSVYLAWFDQCDEESRIIGIYAELDDARDACAKDDPEGWLNPELGCWTYASYRDWLGGIKCYTGSYIVQKEEIQ
jgi:hypothetical protein